MPVQTLVFDFGNVVGFFDHRLTTNRLAAHTELPADVLHASLFGGALEDDYESGRLGTAEFLARARELCRLTCAEEVIGAAWADIFRPNPDVCALLPGLKPRYRLLLASNTNELHARRFCDQFAPFLRHFDELVFSHQVGARKPRAAFFEHCQGLAGCAPAECLFIDDLPANVDGARAHGWQGIVFRDVPDLRARFAALGVLEQPPGAAGPTIPFPES